MGDLGVCDLDMVYMRVIDMWVIVVGVVELKVVELVVGVVGKDCLREVEVMAEGCLLDYLTPFGANHRLVFNHQV